ncbi:hypothetical protein Ppa06_06940 [Planomonospora parontospora subsp. parontospora]|uniref:Cytochrome bc1 complex cytochrome b subunit n=2 Tax=Planomonospora parontospora TaxID=58119 RepID=A0AA37F2T8_9ACTN|nr:hypothetical protein [Planomonospora parontospora]GGK52223.1 hypothetical protein GCM10010126_09660 [Planomonospora parontospora]GII06896.1 hypothetical protein Ppa06_06940 [Planomonospora parontospora subsp. parontospora]
MRQLLGEMLLCCFVIVLISGGFLAFFYTPSGEVIPYGGAYEPLRGVPMSAAYHSILDIGFEVDTGLFVRGLHHSTSLLLGVGTAFWALLGRFRYAFAVLCLIILGGIAGYGAADDLLSGTVLGRVPIPLWYGLHLLLALIVGAALVLSSRREAARRPRTIPFVALSIGLALLAVLAL